MQQLALVVDDSRVARMTLKKLLLAQNLQVVELGSGEDSLVYLKGENVKPDIIFMDVMMGGMDGLTATQQIKADNNLKHIPIVVCTGHDTDADHAKSLQVGAMATLTKPPKTETLDALIKQVSGHIKNVPTNKVATSVSDSTVLLAKLMAMVESNLLPTMQQELRDIAKTVSHQVANETVDRRLAEQINVLTKPEVAIDEKALKTSIIADIEQDLLPKLDKNVREVAEDISRQIAADTAELMVSEQVQSSIYSLLPALKKQLSAESQQVTEGLANSIAKHAAHVAVAKSAEKAAHNAIEELDLSRQITTLLDAEGEQWLQRQKQQVCAQLMNKVEAEFTPMAMTYLNDHLTTMIAPIAHTVVEQALSATEVQTDTLSNSNIDKPDLNKISQQISRLKFLCVGLSTVVLLLAVAMYI
jgi:CheY-like chemotaxis protein